MVLRTRSDDYIVTGDENRRVATTAPDPARRCRQSGQVVGHAVPTAARWRVDVVMTRPRGRYPDAMELQCCDGSTTAMLPTQLRSAHLVPSTWPLSCRRACAAPGLKFSCHDMHRQPEPRGHVHRRTQGWCRCLADQVEADTSCSSPFMTRSLHHQGHTGDVTPSHYLMLKLVESRQCVSGSHRLYFCSPASLY